MSGNKIFRLLLWCSIMLASQAANAIEEQKRSSINTTLQNNESVTATDGKHYVMQLAGMNGFYDEKVQGLVRFRINPANLKDQETPFSTTVNLSVVYDYYDPNSPTWISQSAPFDVNLTISYNPDGETKAEALFEVQGAYKLTATIKPSNNINLPDVGLELFTEINTTRHYDFTRSYFDNSNSSIFKSAAPSFEVDVLTNRLLVQWDPITNAEGYDLEWVHVSSHPASGTTPLSASQILINNDVFKNNATRVSLGREIEEYSIPLLFDQGYLLFRIRGKGRIAADNYVKVYEGNWNTDPLTLSDVSSFNDKFQITPIIAHEGDKNWNYQAVFTENGNNKYSVSYVDGTSRVRQMVVNQNDRDESTVIETFYDHQGRPAIEALPAPTGEPFLKFYQTFNTIDGVTPYSKEDFDEDDTNPLRICESSTSPFYSNTAKASAGRYYSPDNPTNILGEEMYVADAGGFPFAQTLYTPDKTGRIRAKTIPGYEFREGSGRETEFIFTTPYQEELDILFGSDVGYAYKYKKNVTIDANGQASITYINPNDKTIATVLAGASPTNLDELTSKGLTGTSYEVDLLSKAKLADNVGLLERLDFTNGIREITRVIPVLESSIQDFTYLNAGEQYQETCEDVSGGLENFCYDCIFDVEVSLTDDCGEEYLEGVNGSNSIAQTIGLGGTTSASCGSLIGHNMEWGTNEGDGTSPVALTPGAYNLRRTLKLDHVKLQDYTDHFMANNTNCLKTKDEFKTQELNKLLLNTNCDYDCSYCDTKFADDYDNSEYNQVYNIDCDPCFTRKEYEMLIDECYKNCDNGESEKCEIAYQTLISDMSPGGQYGLVSEGGNITTDHQISDFSSEVNPRKFPLSIFNDFNRLPRREIQNKTTTATTVHVPSWRIPIQINSLGERIEATSTYYLNEVGEPYKVYLAKNDDGSFSPAVFQGTTIQYEDGEPFIYPHQLRNAVDFLEIWQPSWAKLLVPYHPEYGYYQYCVSMQKSNNFDQKLIDARSLADLDEVASDFVNSYNTPEFFFNIDPFFFSGTGANPYGDDIDLLRTAMKDRMLNYADGRSIWQIAYILYNCDDLTCPSCIMPDPGDALLELNDSTWHTFKSLYLSIKEQIMKIHAHQKVINSSHPTSYIFPSYNECIGNRYFNKHRYEFFRQLLTWRTTGFWGWKKKYKKYVDDLNSQYFNFGQACNRGTYYLFAKKDKRFDNGASYAGVDELVNEVCGQIKLTSYEPDNCDEKSERIVEELKKKNQVQRYLQCGQCPVAYDLQVLLNGIISNENYLLSDESIPLACNIPQLSKELNSLFQTGGEVDNMPPSTGLIWSNTNGSNDQLDIIIGDCELHLDPVGGLGITYDQINSICCIQAGEGPGDFTFTIYYNDPNDLETELEATIEGNSCLDFINCEFGDKCVVSELGHQFQDLLNNLVSISTVPGGYDLLSNSGLGLNLKSDVYKSVSQKELLAFLQLPNLANQNSQSNANTGLTTSDLHWKNYTSTPSSSTIFDAIIKGSSDCGVKLSTVDGIQTINWTELNYFYDIQPVIHEGSPATNEFYIKVIDGAGNSHQLIGHSCIPIKECEPYLNQQLLSSHKTEKNRVCDETPLFYNIKSQLESITDFSFMSGQQSTYTGINLIGGGTCNAIITLDDNPYIEPLTNSVSPHNSKTLADVISIEDFFTIRADENNKKFFATVIFSDNTHGTISIITDCGDVVSCINKTPPNPNYKCETTSIGNEIQSKFQSYIDNNKSSLTLVTGDPDRDDHYVLSGLIQGCNVLLYEGMDYITSYNGITHSYTVASPLIDVTQIDKLHDFYVVEEPNASGEFRFGYVVCKLFNGKLVEFKMELLGDCVFGHCSSCFKENLITNGDFSSVNTVSYLTANPLCTLGYVSALPYLANFVNAYQYSIVTYTNYYEHFYGYPKGFGDFKSHPGCTPANLGLHSSISGESTEDMTGNFLLAVANQYSANHPSDILWEETIEVVPGQSYEFMVDAFHWINYYQGCIPRFRVKIDDVQNPSNITNIVSKTIDNTSNLWQAFMQALKYQATCPNQPFPYAFHKESDGFPIDWTNINIPFLPQNTALISVKIELIAALEDPNYVGPAPSFQSANCSDIMYYGFDNISVREVCIPPPTELCKPNTYPPVALEVIKPSCEDELDATAEYSANVLYKRYIDSVRQNFKEGYIEKCLNVYEEFNLNHTEGEHHHTLYYYDQSGNLVRTIPPKGINKLSIADAQKARKDRANGKKTIFTEHEMPTTYAYNSLGQLQQQSVPDHDDLDIFNTDYIDNTNSGLPVNFSIRDMYFTSTQKGVLVGYDDPLSLDRGSIYLTINGGKSWQKASNTGIDDYNYISPEKHIVGDNGQLLIQDYGNWLKRTSPTNENLIYLQITQVEEELYIYSENGNRWFSQDNGLTWGAKNDNLANKLNGKITAYELDKVSLIGIAVSDLGEIFFTTNFGNSWSKRSNIRAGNLTSISKVNGNYIIAGEEGSIIQYNGGSSLTDHKSGLYAEVLELHTSSTNDWLAVYDDASTGNIMLKSTDDGGKTWAMGTSFFAEDIEDIYFQDSDLGYLITSNNLTKTTNAGGSWTHQSTFPGSNYSAVYSEGANVFVGTTNGNIEYSINGVNGSTTVLSGQAIKELMLDEANGIGVVLLANNDIYQSNTGTASTWTWTKLAGNYAANNFIDIHFIDLLKGFALTDQGILISTIDAGDNWIPNTDFATSKLKSVHISSMAGDGVIVGDDGEVRTTANGGSTWSDLSGSVNLQALKDVCLDVGNAIYAVGENGTLIKSTDNAVSWKLMDSKTINELTTIDVNASNGMLGGDQLVGEILGGSVNDITATAYHVKELNYNGASSTILHNNGLEIGAYGSLSAKSMPAHTFNSVFYSSPIVVSVADNGIMYESMNDGGTWTVANEFTPPALTSVYAINNNTWLAGGTDSYLTISKDGGNSWTDFEDQISISGAAISSIYFVNEGLGMVGLDNGEAHEYVKNPIPPATKWNVMNTTSGSIANASCPISDVFMWNTQKGIILNECDLYFTNHGVSALWETMAFTNTKSSGALKSVVMVDEDRGYAAGEFGRFVEINRNTNGFLEATDKGHNIPIPSNGTINEIYFADRVRGYAVGWDQLYVTVDAGVTWTFKEHIGGQNQAEIHQIAFTELGIGYYAGNEGTVGNITDFAEYFSDRFYYDKLGRIVASQNSKQFNYDSDVYSYTLFDGLGRVTELGEINAQKPIEQNIVNALLDQDLFEAWISNGIKSQITRTYYDYPMDCSLGLVQENLRSRISSTTYEEIEDPTKDLCIYDQATHYNYDVFGNVSTVIQDFPSLSTLNERFKTIDYEYDLVSGKVTKVKYQKGENDQFYYRYDYNSDNRIEQVFTSTNGFVWTEEVDYEYFRHGFLKRVELGEWDVQGVDYVYTSQGWMKGVNSNTMQPNRDIGKDGYSTSLSNQDVAVDAYGFSLAYYNEDYSSIGNQSENFIADIGSSHIGSSLEELYNGNINHMVTSFTDNTTDGTGPQAMVYKYDQLNRIKSADSYTDVNIAGNTWGNATPQGKYNTTYTYDDNGNIETLTRNDDKGDSMDSFDYKYHHPSDTDDPDDLGGRKTNRLLAVQDGEDNSSINYDIKDGQDFSSTALLDNNYGYDEIGNLTKDEQEDIEKITWTVLGKIKTIERKVEPEVEAPDFEFFYDAAGNRVRKILKPRRSSTGELLNEDSWIETIYVRDAQGTVLSTYNKKYSIDESGNNQYFESLNQKELHLYGSDRLGTYNRSEEIAKVNFYSTMNTTTGRFGPIDLNEAFALIQTDKYDLFKGYRNYELKNHLGNVLAVVNDNKRPIYSSSQVVSTIFSDFFEEESGEWRTYRSSDIYVEEGVLNVNVSDPESGITRNLNLTASANCTYEFCFILNEPIPEGLMFITLDANGDIFEQFEVTESNMCFNINHTAVVSVGFMLPEPGTFGLISAELKSSCSVGSFTHYAAILKQRNDYYPFGMLMPNRGLKTGEGHRYGFNGMERDDMVKGNGNSYDFGERIYSPRLGRFMSIDPLTKKFPHYSPYSYAANNPLLFIDNKGEEPITAIIDAFNAFALSAGMDFLGNYILNDMEAEQAFDAIDWADASLEGIKSYGISLIFSGLGTVKAIRKVGKSPIGKVAISTMENATEELINLYNSGAFNDEDGDFDIGKLMNTELMKEVFVDAFIEALVEQGFGKKAEQLTKKYGKLGKKLGKAENKVTKKINNQAKKKVISKAENKVNKVQKKLVKNVGNQVITNAKDQVGSEFVGDAAKKILTEGPADQ